MLKFTVKSKTKINAKTVKLETFKFYAYLGKNINTGGKFYIASRLKKATIAFTQ